MPAAVCAGDMVQEDKHIYRNPDGVIGGVCDGIARRFDLDAALVRLAALLLSVVTAGAFVLVYVLAWLILPKCPNGDCAVDVAPDAIQSEIYEQVVLGSGTRDAHAYPARMQAQVSVSPVPPPGTGGSFSARTHATASPVASLRDGQTRSPQASTPVALALVGGVFLVVFGAAALFASIDARYSVVQFWPLAVVAAGVVRIVIPCKDKTRTLSTWLGLFIIFIGLAMLSSTLGIYSLSIREWLERAGALLFVALGLFVMGRASGSSLLVVGAVLALALFCAAGAVMGFEAIPLDELGASMPFGLDDLLLRWIGV